LGYENAILPFVAFRDIQKPLISLDSSRTAFRNIWRVFWNTGNFLEHFWNISGTFLKER